MGDLFLEHEHLLASLQLMLAMAGMGATLTIADFAEVVRVPRGILVGLATQLLAIPLLAIGVAALFDLPPGLAVGLLLVAAVPGGTMSNVLTYFARGHVALSISLTGLTTVACLVTTPLVLSMLAAAHLPADVAMPSGRIAFEIAVCLLGPLAFGMTLRATIPPRLASVFARWSIRASILVIVVIATGAGSSGRIDPVDHGWLALLAIASFTVAALVIGTVAGALARVRVSERIAIGIEASFRNTNLGILVKAALFPAAAGRPDPFGDSVLLMYAGFAFAVATVPVIWHRRIVARAAS